MASLYDLDEEPTSPLSPCSSCDTYVPTSPAQACPAPLTIICPNLFDRISVNIEDVEQFVALRLHRSVDVTVVHLLIYLFSRNTDPAVTMVNHLRLLHTGKQYAVQRLADLLNSNALLKDVTAQFSTFQLVKTSAVATPLMLTLDALVARTTLGPAPPPPDVPVTYAEAMVKKIRRFRRKLSASSIDYVPARTTSRDSTTDIKDVDGRPSKIGITLKRVFRRSSIST